MDGLETQGQEPNVIVEGRFVRWSRGGLLGIAVILLVVANLAFWLQHTILDSNEFTSKVDRVISRPEASDRLGEVLADQALASTDLREKLAAALPGNTSFLAVIAENPIAELISQVISRTLQLQATRDAILGAVRQMHSTVVTTLEGRNGRFDVDGGQIVLHLDGVLTGFLARLGIEAPQGGADSEAGSIVLVQDAGGLSRLSRFVRIADDSVPFLLGGTVAAFAGAVFLFRTKSQGLAAVSYALVIAGIVVLVSWRLSTWSAFAFLDEAPVARMMIGSLAANLKTQAFVVIFFGGVLVLFFDVRVRAWLSGVASGVIAQAEAFGHGRALLLGAAGLVLLALVT